jgi:maleylpyruvate isomerase
MSQSAGPHSVDLLIGRINESVDRLLASASALDDERMREPSLLPGWSRGHVLTHIARSGDGLRNLLVWARTGEEKPQYASAQARTDGIEAGAGRPAREIQADLEASARAFIDEAHEVHGDAWLTQVRAIRGPAHPAWFTLHRRIFEVEVHHADLGAGYHPGDWPGWFVSDELYRIGGELAANPDTPPAVLNDASTGRQYFLRADQQAGDDEVTVTGPGYALLAWLIGRDSDGELTTDPGGELPAIPSYG